MGADNEATISDEMLRDYAEWETTDENEPDTCIGCNTEIYLLPDADPCPMCPTCVWNTLDALVAEVRRRRAEEETRPPALPRNERGTCSCPWGSRHTCPVHGSY